MDKYHSNQQKFKGEIIQNLVESVRCKGKSQAKINSLVAEKRARNSEKLFVMNARWIISLQDERERRYRSCPTLTATRVKSGTGSRPVLDLHVVVLDPFYRRFAATTAYNLLNFSELEEKYNAIRTR